MTETGVLTFTSSSRGDLRRRRRAGEPPIPGMDLQIRREDGARRQGGRRAVRARSRYLLSGYWGRPDLDARVLSVDEEGVPVYRTGDVARVDPPGFLGWRAAPTTR